MSNKIEKFLDFIRALTVAVIAAISGVVLDSIIKLLNSKLLAFVTLTLGSIVFFKLIEFAASKIVDSYVPLRRLIVGLEFIEGWWVDLVITPDKNREVDSIGILQIIYEGDHYMAYGVNLDATDVKGKELGNFRCYACYYDNLVFQFAYDGANIRKTGSKVDGHGEYRFTRQLGCPVSFSGFLDDSFYHKTLLLKGYKITDKSFIKKINEAETRQKIVEWAISKV